MPTLAVFLMSIAVPLVKKVLLALGIGLVTYGTLSVLAAQVRNEVIGLWGQAPATVMALATLSGLPESVGILLGAFSARIAFLSASKFGRIAS